MSIATLNQAPMLTVTLPASPTQAEWEAALDWVNANVAPGQEGIFLDHGDVTVWAFPAA
jgi:hypothetical protein